MEAEPSTQFSSRERQSASAGIPQTPSRNSNVTYQLGSSAPDGLTVIYQLPAGTASIESTLEALRLSAEAEAEPDSSIEFILTPPRHPRHSEPLARSTPAFPTVDARPRSVSTELPTASQEEANVSPPKKLVKVSDLNPEVAPFLTQKTLAPASAASLLARFHAIVKEGKDMIGELRLDAKTALADLGLKPIPSLHGSAQLPYARNPSGIDSFYFSVDEDDEAFTPTDDDYGVRARPGPQPLPGNARYTNAGRLVQQRVSSAPAVLGGAEAARKAASQSSSAIMPNVSSRVSPRRRKEAQCSARPLSGGVTLAAQALVTMPPAAPFALSVSRNELVITQAAVAAQERLMAQQAQQAHLAQQAQLMLLAAQHASKSPCPCPADIANEPAYASIVPGFTFPSARPGQEQKAMPAISSTLAGLTSYPFSPPSVDSARRQSVVISPNGHVDIVDSLAVLSLAQQHRHGTGSQNMQQCLAPFGDSIWATSPVLGSAETAEYATTRGLPKPVSASPPTSSAHASLPKVKNHKRSDSDTGLTKKAYLESGRRKSTAPHFPSRRAARKGSLPPALHASSSTSVGSAEAMGAANPSGSLANEHEPRRAFADIANRLPTVQEPLVEHSRTSASDLHDTLSAASTATSAPQSKGKKQSGRRKLDSTVVAASAKSQPIRPENVVSTTPSESAVWNKSTATSTVIPTGVGGSDGSKCGSKRRAKAGRNKDKSTASTSQATSKVAP